MDTNIITAYEEMMRTDAVKRYGGVMDRHNNPQSVMNHTFLATGLMVQYIAAAQAGAKALEPHLPAMSDGRVARLLLGIILHDVPEIYTGDVLYTTKVLLKRIDPDVMTDVEEEMSTDSQMLAAEHTLKMELDEDEQAILSFIDCLELVFHCAHQISISNFRFARPYFKGKQILAKHVLRNPHLFPDVILRAVAALSDEIGELQEQFQRPEIRIGKQALSVEGWVHFFEGHKIVWEEKLLEHGGTLD